ncbi:MAG: ATP-binding protein [Candidatus Promineifilaceae bacterium]
MKTAESSFYYDGPITPGGIEPYLEPTIAPAIVQDLSYQRCCLLIGPPGSGTSTTLKAVEQRLLEKQPVTQWWYIDLNRLPTDSAHELFRELAVEGARRFPNQRQSWMNLAQLNPTDLLIDKLFCETLIRSVKNSNQRYVLAIDHIENTPRDIAKTVIGSVRSLYTNWDRSKLGPRMITVILAGSHRLRRQGVAHGSPLNFAQKHFMPELNRAESLKLLKEVKIGSRQLFSHAAAAYLAEMTDGDRYLLQRLGQICLDASQSKTANGKVNKALARKVVEAFILTSYWQDPKLSELIPELIKDMQALYMIRWFLTNPDRELDGYWLASGEITAGIMRLLQIENNRIQVRNKIYQRILEENAPVIESAYHLHKINEEKLDRMAKFQNLVAQADVASESNQAMEDLLKAIAEFFEVEQGVSLMRYDAVEESYKVEATYPAEMSIVSAIPDAEGELSARLISERKTNCLSIGSLCRHCAEKVRGNCSWLSLDLNEGTEHIGALIVPGSNWELSFPKKQESTLLLNALGSALLTRQRRRGLSLLSQVRVNQSSVSSIGEHLCQAVAALYNRPTVYLWDGNQAGRTLSLTASPLVNSSDNFELDVKTILNILGDSNDIVTNEYLFILNNVPGDAINTLMRRLSLESLVLSSFKYGENRMGVIGIGSTRPWRPSKTEQALFNLVGERVQTTLENLHFIDLSKRRMESSKHAAHLLSHELKSEPARISREIEILTKGKNPLTLEEIEKGLGRIGHWAQDQQAIVDRLVQFAQLDANIWDLGTLQKYALNNLIQKLLKEISEEDESRKYRLDFEPCHQELFKSVDEYSMRLILKNLIQNSIQYAPGSLVNFKTWAENETFYLSISDEGPGVEPQHQVSLFNAFDRGRYNETRIGQKGNLGLGLYLVQELMKLHGGRVIYDSSYTKGAKFILTLPLNEEGGLNGTPVIND